MDKINGLDPKRKMIGIHFTPDFENAFEEDYYHRHLYILRLGIIMSIVLFSLVGIEDIWVASESKMEIWFIRYAILDPFLLASFCVTYTPFFKEYMQEIMMLVQLVSGAAAISIIAVLNDGEVANYYYYAGLMLIIFGNFTLLGLRFVNATIVSIFIVLGYECTAILVQGSLDQSVDHFLHLTFINNNFFLLSALFIGMVTGYLLEQSERRAFMHKTEIERKTEQLIETNQLLNKLSYTDGLTHVNNRRGFDLRLAEERHRALRYKEHLSLILLDIDDFKQYNDRYGHQQGDECLIAVSKALSSSVRRSRDYIARYGGEEFVIILPDTDDKGVEYVTNLMHQKIKELSLPHASSDYGCITISVGAVSMDPHRTNTSEELLKMADQALYESKNKGKNCTTIVKMNGDVMHSFGQKEPGA